MTAQTYLVINEQLGEMRLKIHFEWCGLGITLIECSLRLT